MTRQAGQRSVLRDSADHTHTISSAAPAPVTPDAPPRSPGPKPSNLTVARGVGVVFVGPLLLDALEVLGPLSALGRWPERVAGTRLRSVGRWLTVAGVLAPVVDHGIVRPWLRRWGSQPGERIRRLPGDPDRRLPLRITRAVSVDASAEEVWQWLVQIGQDRGGFYSYDWLENLAGCRLHSAEQIREEWQHLHAGDPLPVFPGLATTVTEVKAPDALVIEGWGAYIIEPLDDSTCRLIARAHVEPGLSSVFYVLLVELPHAIMERKMLLGIKQRAERSRR